MLTRESFRHLALAIILVMAVPAIAQAKNYALLIGVEGYTAGSRFTTLRYSADDAEKMRDFLKTCNYDVTILSDDTVQPTKDNIKTHLRRLAANKSAEDTILVSISGHGICKKSGDQKTSYFAPIDGKADNENTLLDYNDEIFPILEKCRAARKFIFIDACQDLDDVGGRPAAAGARAADPEFDWVIDDQDNYGLIALFSCGKGQKSFEHDALGQGIFSYHLLEALKARNARDNVIRFNDVFHHVNTTVEAYVLKHKNREQVPFYPGNAGAVRASILVVPQRGKRASVNGFTLGVNNKIYAGKLVEDLTFTGTFKSTDFRGTKFKNCLFKDCTFRGVQLNQTQFEDCDFVNVKMEKTSLKTAMIRGRSLVQGDEPWANSDLRRTNKRVKVDVRR